MIAPATSSQRRAGRVAAALAVLWPLLLVLALTTGDYPIAAPDALAALVGRGDDVARLIVVEGRLPRAALALLLGAALGVSGALFQSLTRNPLGSPDIIGFAAGAETGALVILLVLPAAGLPVALGALAGGFAAAALVWALTRGDGAGLRLIVIGIAVAAALTAFNAWLIRRAALEAALSAAIWGGGSLNGVGLAAVPPVAAALIVAVPLLLALTPAIRQLELGDDLARASGVAVASTRAAMALIGVALTAIATAVAGPIAFVALSAPHIAGRLAAAPGFAPTLAALTGGVLLAAADWAAQHALPVPLPVGIVTAGLGGGHFLWLLLREGRR